MKPKEHTCPWCSETIIGLDALLEHAEQHLNDGQRACDPDPEAKS